LAQGSKRPPARKRRIEVVPVDGEAADVLSRAPRRGRPRLPAEEGKRYPIAIRTTKELKERLERASKASGRSLAQELEFRLERSFEVQDIADAVCPVIARISDQISELGLFVTLADALRAAGSGATVADALRGGTLADAPRGGILADAPRGGILADALRGGILADALRGGPLADALRGGTLADALRGGPLADALRGGTLADALRGGTLADALRGGTLADALRGGTLADALRGGPLADALHGSEQAASAAGKVPGNRLRAGAAVAPTGRERHRSGER
jgi:hypothetical protein